MKRKILFVCGHMRIGGVEKSLLDFIRHLDSQKYEIFLLLVEAANGEYIHQIPNHVHIQTLNSEKLDGPFFQAFTYSLKKRDWKSVRFKFSQLLSRFVGIKAYSLLKRDVFNGMNFDISIGFKPDHCSYISTFATNARYKVTWWHHGDFLIDSKKYIKLCKANDNIICVSKGTKKLLTKIGVNESSILVIPNMLDVDNIKQKAYWFSPKYPLEIINIVSVSRLAPEKQFDLIPAIASTLKKKIPCKFLWHIVGDGCMRDTITSEIMKFAVQDCVIMHGNQTNPYPYIINADLFVHPSRVESQGLAVLEALSLGVPVVAGSTIGTKEYIKDGVNGLLSQPDKQHLCEAIVKILDSEDLYQHLKNHSQAPQNLLPQNIISKFEEVFL